VRPGAVDPQTGLILPDGDHTSSWKAGYVNLSYGFYDQHGRLRTVGSLGFTGPRSELEQHVGKVAIVKGYGEQFESGSYSILFFNLFVMTKMHAIVYLIFRNSMGKKIDMLGRVCGQLTVIDFDRTINGGLLLVM